MNGFFKLRGFFRLITVLAVAVAAAASTAYSAGETKKLLVVSVTKKFRHTSIPVAEKIIAQLGEKSGSFTVDFARSDEELAAKMTVAALKNYDGVLFASTTGDIPLPDREAFLNWIKTGRAFIGVHSATDTFHDYAPYVEMIGGEFLTHGPQLKVNLVIEDASHAATGHFDNAYEILDEIYIFKNFNRERVRVLISLDKNPNKNDAAGFNQPGYYPIAWCREYGRGRIFYTALGHREDVLESEPFKQHLLGGIQWAFKQAKGNASPRKTKSESR